MDAIVKEIGLKNNCTLSFWVLSYIKNANCNCLQQGHYVFILVCLFVVWFVSGITLKVTDKMTDEMNICVY